MKCPIWFPLMVGCLFVGGCRQQAQHDIEKESARTKFRQLHEFMNNGCVGMTNLNAIGGVINSWISSVSNASHRTELARELSDVILSVDLTNQPYRVFATNGTGYGYSPRDRAMDFYPEFVNATCWVMKDNGCSTRSVMEFLLQALQKYKNASFSIPPDFCPLPGESREICSARRSCARGAYEYYVQTMNLIRRSLLPNQCSVLYVPPTELQDEFKHRIEPFFDFPSKEEFYPRLYPGWKDRPPKSSELKHEATKPDDVVEVDI